MKEDHKMNYRQANIEAARFNAAASGKTQWVYRILSPILKGPNKGTPGRRPCYVVTDSIEKPKCDGGDVQMIYVALPKRRL